MACSTMVDAMSKALDELMGKHRNLGGPEADKLKLRMEDPEVCKHELVGLCPYTLFNNTRSDLGAPPLFEGSCVPC